MRAAVLHGLNQAFSVEDVALPHPGAGEVRIRVAGAGVCHSDLQLRSGDLPLIKTFPQILGHENAGYVESLGEGVSTFVLGEPVLVYGAWGCGLCRFCLRGDEQLCAEMLERQAGIGAPGGYAEYMVVPATRYLVRLGDLDPAAAAPLADAGLTAYRAVRRSLAQHSPHSVVVVIGVGGLGRFAIQYLKLLSPARIVAVDVSASQLEIAAGLGADLVVNPGEADIVKEIGRFSGGEGAAAVLDFVGNDASLTAAARSVARQGHVIVIGLGGGSTRFGVRSVPEAQFSTVAWGSRQELADVVVLAQRGLIHSEVERVPLDRVNESFDRLAAGTVNGRLVLTPVISSTD